ncbi:uncharacterized protein LOC142972537 isoform X2 [Anticarsia gemmatalis]|uniref:uncharacterized protein LOC142972537 isoform X2 n=1 Tax=Anticarsia gemmatalis TaxID=129554 RepID=UPI003F7709B9
MVNYRRVVCEVALLGALVAVVSGAPTPDCVQKHYDQRQNGSENYRVNIDGVVIAVAPAESLMSALGDMDDLFDLAMEDFDFKPKPPQDSSSSPLDISFGPQTGNGDKPLLEKPQEKPSVDKVTIEKPQEEKPDLYVPAKPETPSKPAEPISPLSDVSMGDDLKIQKKEVSQKNKQEKAKRSP